MDLVSMVLNRRFLYFVWLLYIINIQGMAGLSMVVSPSPTVQVVSGQTASITCQWSADYTGPFAAVNYRLNDGGGTIGTMFINFGTGCPSSTPPFTITCNRDRRTLGVQISANGYSHGDRWTCEGRNDSLDNTTPPQTDMTTIDVRVPVTSVTIIPSTTVTVDVGTSTTLSCTTQPHSRPTASVTWYRVDSGQPQQITANISVSHDTQNSAQTTTSAMSYVPSREDNGRTVYCVSDRGWTGSTETTLESSRVSLNVRYPPISPVTVTGNSDPLYDGDDINLRCSISGGNPVASLTWTCPGHSVTTTPDNTGDTAASVLNIQLTPLYNGANCTCTATHSVQAFRTSHTEVFNVYFAPRINALTVTEPFPWLAWENFIGRLNCNATAGHPSTIRYTWYRDSTQVTAQTSQEISFWPPMSEDNGRLYKCKVENDFTDARGSAAESNTVRLDVEYAPIITLSACPDKINETDTYHCTCTAVGNPNPTVTWYPRDSTTNHILDFPSIDRTKAGRYTCNATSSSQKFGTLQTQSSLNLVVQYAPDVELSVQNSTEHDTDLVMSCTADGVPNIYTYGVWTHVFNTMLVRTLDGDVSTQGRTLTLASVSFQDIGTYTCQVQNSIRGRNGQLFQIGTSFFDVRGVARLLETKSRYITEKYQHLNVTMTFISHPSPTEMFLSKNVRLSSSTDLNITFSKDTINDMFYDKVIPREGYKMILIFPSFQINQEGEYNLTVINGLSSNLIYTFNIIIIDVPDFPTDMSIDKITTDSAVVSWKPGLNRGREEQIFHIWIKKINTNVWQKYDASYDMTQKEIPGLNSDSSYIVILFAENEKGQSGNTTRNFKTVSQSDDMCQFYKDMYASSIVLICTSVVILLITIGIAVLTARSGKLPCMKPRMGIQNTSPKTRTGMDDYEHEMSRMRHGQERHVYTDLDKTDFAEKNVYDQVMNEQNIAVGGQAESNYEQLQGVRSGPNVYEELKGGKDTSSNRIYVNTSSRDVK